MMYCSGCGSQMHEQAAACPSCGKPNAMLAQSQDTPSSWLSFSGRIPRKVYWLHYALPLWAIGVVAQIIDGAAGARGILTGLVSLVLLFPQLAASAKRCHDRDRSAWFILINALPIIGWVWYFVEIGCLRGTPGPNRFGSDPVGLDRPDRMPIQARYG